MLEHCLDKNAVAMKRRMNEQVRAAIISFLVAMEEPETPEIAQALADEWYDIADDELIQANNYNQIRRYQAIRTVRR